MLADPPPPLAARRPTCRPICVAIVTKAMAREPADRYPNAEEIAEELKRFQTGQLVQPPLHAPQLVRRWFRRHRGAVAVGAIAACIIGVGGVMGVAQIVAAQQDSAAAEQVALANRRDAEDLIDYMVVDLRRGLEPVGKVDLLFEVASRARDYDDRKPVADHHAILARENLAEVLAAQGNERAALDEHAAALAMAQAFAIAEPANPTWQHDLAMAHRELGYAFDTGGNLAAARVEFDALIGIARTALARAADASWMHDLQDGELGLGHVLLAQGDPEAALAAYRTALELASSRAAANPDDRASQRDVMVAHNRVGDALADRGHRDEALVEYRASLAIATRLGASGTDVVALRDSGRFRTAGSGSRSRSSAIVRPRSPSSAPRRRSTTASRVTIRRTRAGSATARSARTRCRSSCSRTARTPRRSRAIARCSRSARAWPRTPPTARSHSTISG